ncbi:MAG: DUF4410 domain-containing protein [Chthoniobacterales bacterium]
MEKLRKKYVWVWASCFVLFILTLSGCASVSVSRTEYRQKSAKPILPQKVYVENFAYSPDSLSIRRNADRDFQWTVSDRLNRALVQRIRARIASAQPVAQGVPFPRQNAWLIKGRFTQVNEGGRFLRLLLGLGYGATTFSTVAEVYDLRDGAAARKPFLILETQGGSNAMPGLLCGNPLELRSGLTVDAQRTAREITRSLLEYLTVHNCIDATFADTPKRPGSWR